MRFFGIMLCAALTLTVCSAAQAGTIVHFDTSMGGFDVELYNAQTPVTTANFLNYVNDGDYTNTFIHRSVPGFVIQGGGFGIVGGSGFFVPADPPIVNEPGILNTRGTIAMAKLGGDPNSATSQWFFNLADNTDLDTQNGGFTVFGHVLGNGMDVVDAIAALQVWDASGIYSAFGEIPLIAYDPILNPDFAGNLVMVNGVTVVPEPACLVILAVGGLVMLRRRSRR